MQWAPRRARRRNPRALGRRGRSDWGHGRRSTPVAPAGRRRPSSSRCEFRSSTPRPTMRKRNKQTSGGRQASRPIGPGSPWTDGRFVANACIYSLDLTLPARRGRPRRSVPFAGVTAVGVHPDPPPPGSAAPADGRMLADARARGEAFAGLIASESVIYGRFGFGHATSAAELTIDSARSAFLVPAPTSTSASSTATQASKLLPGAVRPAAPVPSRRAQPRRSRSGRTSWLTGPYRRHGGSGLFVGRLRRGLRGLSRPRRPTSCGRPTPRVVIEELRGLTPDVEAGLWRFVLDLDLVGRSSPSGGPRRTAALAAG